MRSAPAWVLVLLLGSTSCRPATDADAEYYKRLPSQSRLINEAVMEVDAYQRLHRRLPSPKELTEALQKSGSPALVELSKLGPVRFKVTQEKDAYILEYQIVGAGADQRGRVVGSILK